jgi:hypothetical protein
LGERVPKVSPFNILSRFVIHHKETITFLYSTLYSGKLQRHEEKAPSAYQTPCEDKRMEETLCNIEFLKKATTYLARVQSELGGLREYRSNTFEEVLEQVIIDLQEEFESTS